MSKKLKLSIKISIAAAITCAAILSTFEYSLIENAVSSLITGFFCGFSTHILIESVKLSASTSKVIKPQ